MTYVHVVHGWVWNWGQQVGGNATWPCLGGSSGGDDLNENRSRRKHMRSKLLEQIVSMIRTPIRHSHTLS